MYQFPKKEIISKDKPNNTFKIEPKAKNDPKDKVKEGSTDKKDAPKPNIAPKQEYNKDRRKEKNKRNKKPSETLEESKKRVESVEYQKSLLSLRYGPSERLGELAKDTLSERQKYSYLNNLLEPYVIKGHNDSILSSALSADGKFALSGGIDKSLRVWDLQKRQCVKSFLNHTNTIRSVSLSADGRLGLSGSQSSDYNNHLLFWDFDKNTSLRLVGHKNTVVSVSLSSDGNRALSGSADHTAKLWDTKNGICIQTLDHPDSVDSVRLSADSVFALSGCWDKTVRLFDLRVGKCLYEMLGHTSGSIDSIDMSADSKFGLSGASDKTVRLWDLQNGKCLQIFDTIGAALGVSFIPNSNILLAGDGFGQTTNMYIWDFKKGNCNTVSYCASIKSISPYIHNHQLYALTSLCEGTLDFRHICELYDSKSKSEELTQSSFAQSSKPVPDLSQQQASLPTISSSQTVDAAPGKKLGLETKDVKEEVELRNFLPSFTATQNIQNNISNVNVGLPGTAGIHFQSSASSSSTNENVISSSALNRP